MKLLITILLFPLFVSAQSIDTFSNARSYTNTYLHIPNFYGLTTSGSVYGLGLKLNYDVDGNPLEMQATRINYATNTATYKTMPASVSNASVLWRYVMDSTGSIYLGLNSGNRKIWRFSYKDSIRLQNLGNGFFGTEETLAYSIALGRDKNMYFGGSSSNISTSVSYYNPYTETMTKYNQIDADQDYVLTLGGDYDWIYSSVGQRSFNYLWALRKSDGYKKKLDSVPSSTIWSIGSFTNGAVASKGGTPDTYYLHDTTMSLSFPVGGIGTNVYYFEVNDGISYENPTFKTASSYYNPATSRLSYKVDTDTGSTLISSSYIATGTSMVFTDNADTNKIYYIGSYYGNWYRYNIATATSTELGLGVGNIYSWVQYNDSIFYMGGYPSGELILYNKNQEWTAETFYNGTVRHLSATTNPKLIVYFRSETDAEFSHTFFLLKTIDNYIVGAGDVIRTSSTSSIASYNPATGVSIGYDADKMPLDIGVSGIAEYNGKVLMSTSGAGCKLYIWDYKNNIMIDSIDLGFNDYGVLYIIGDKLIGVAADRIYNYNLTQRILVNSRSYAANSITYSSMMPDGRILIKSTGITLPTDMTATFVPYNTTLGAANYSNTYIYTQNGSGTISRLKNYYSSDAGLSTPQQRRIFTLRKLNLIP